MAKALFNPMMLAGLSFILSCYALYNTRQTTKTDWHWQLRGSLDRIAALERESLLNADESPCADEGCLGNLAMERAYRDQYQLVTAEAIELAERIPKLVTTIEFLELANALYVSGDLNESSKYVEKVKEREPGFLLSYRAILLEAQIAFFQRDLRYCNNLWMRESEIQAASLATFSPSTN